jgi:hypothetical protein
MFNWYRPLILFHEVRDDVRNPSSSIVVVVAYTVQIYIENPSKVIQWEVPKIAALPPSATSDNPLICFPC